nr:unnamed protein product [Callosobruchus chinensis]
MQSREGQFVSSVTRP